MPSPRLSVIVPTLGRPTLEQTLHSIRAQARPETEVIVVADSAGDVDAARAITTETLGARRRGMSFFHVADGSDHGYPQRTRGMELATGTHLAFIDDDDVYEAGGLTLMQHALDEQPVIFRMAHPEIGIVWRDPSLRYGNVGTPMFVVPNDPGRLGVWTAAPESGENRCGGDFAFISDCVAAMGDPVWRQELVAVVRPDLPAHPELDAWRQAQIDDAVVGRVLMRRHRLS